MRVSLLHKLRVRTHPFSSDLICRSAGGDSEIFIELQTESELMRVLIAILICPTIGFITDSLMCIWKNYHKGSREVLYTAPAFISLISVRVQLPEYGIFCLMSGKLNLSSCNRSCIIIILDEYMANIDFHCFGNGTHLRF